jgi:hypothetical protein
MDIDSFDLEGATLPRWVPDSVRRYLEHTEKGVSLRHVARRDGCHASTVLRQVRRFENRRDDPLVDEALERLSRHIASPSAATDLNLHKGNERMSIPLRTPLVPDEDTLAREARRILRRLCESGAVLALAPDMDKAVVLRTHADGSPTRTAVVSREIAHAFALKEWVTCQGTGRVVRYVITTAGRAALKGFLSEDMDRKREKLEMAESQSPFTAQHIDWAGREAGGDAQQVRMRYNMSESPLAMLGRRRDKDGQPFLDSTLVQAGERFREDFELAQLGPSVAQNWERFMASGDRSLFEADAPLSDGLSAARERILNALEDLGPGLGDIIMRCCCFLEGLEAAEKRMGWSARSGKVVLRIALQRLHRHYVDIHGRVSAMIG